MIVTWAMGLTQHKKAVPTIKEIMNVLLLRGNIGKPGAGPCPIRGHSNVQGDRTMGIWEQMPEDFMDKLAAEFDFAPPRKHGLDAVQSIQAMRDGKIKVLIALGGNLVHAISDTGVAQEAIQRTGLSVQISTKLNRSHAYTGEQALILPTLGRSDIDIQASGPQFVTVEDTVCAVHASQGRVMPVSEKMLSEVSIVSRMARAVLGAGHPFSWEAFEENYDSIREHIARVVDGCEDYNAKVRRTGRFHPGPPAAGFAQFPDPQRQGRDHRQRTGDHRAAGKPADPAVAALARPVQHHHLQPERPLPRGAQGPQRPVRESRGPARARLRDGGYVDVHSEAGDGVDRVLRQLRVIAYPTARGCAATYFPEGNVLVPLEATAEGSNTPVSKSIIIRLEHAPAPDFAGVK